MPPVSNGTSPARVTPLSAADVLRAAADLIEPEGAWTQGVYARGADGTKRVETSPGAVCWCASGAIWRAAANHLGRIALMGDVYRIHDALGGVVGSIAHWNDAPERTQAEVVAALRLAAERCESGAGDSGTTHPEAPQ